MFTPSSIYPRKNCRKATVISWDWRVRMTTKLNWIFLVFLLVLQLAIIFQYCTATADHKKWQKVHFWVQSLLFSFSLPSLLFSKTIKNVNALEGSFRNLSFWCVLSESAKKSKLNGPGENYSKDNSENRS